MQQVVVHHQIAQTKTTLLAWRELSRGLKVSTQVKMFFFCVHYPSL